MHRTILPLSALDAWSRLNDVTYLDCQTQKFEDARGVGLVTAKKLSSKNTFEKPTLLIIPHDLVLSAEAVEEFAKVDQYFKELLAVAGGKGLRNDVMLFLLMQITCHPDGQSVGVSNPWTEYVKFLPERVPVPSLWSAEESMLLTGTSLQPALAAKKSALLREFEHLREKTSGISWCRKFWWDNETLTLNEWTLLDAWFRSRSLDLPNCGESMVPCLDMANHSSAADAYYEQFSSDNSVSVLLNPDVEVDAGSELTISYGYSKSNAEMLFSYGFIDESDKTLQTLVLPIEAMPDDPLAKAKAVAFNGQPVVRITNEKGHLEWDSPFLYFMSLNEEDGLEFKVLQDVDGSRSLRVFWSGKDVTDVTETFQSLIQSHELRDVFMLRVLTLLAQRVGKQLDRLESSAAAVRSLSSISELDPDVEKNAWRLRASETLTLIEAAENLEKEKNELFQSQIVKEYLGMGINDDRMDQQESRDNEAIEDDFS